MSYLYRVTLLSRVENLPIGSNVEFPCDLYAKSLGAKIMDQAARDAFYRKYGVYVKCPLSHVKVENLTTLAE